MRTRQRTRTRVRSAVAAVLAVAWMMGETPLYGGGLQAIPAQARGSALGSATVALSSDPGGFARNPALLGASVGTRLTLGAGLIVPEFRFAGIAPSEAETKAEPVFMFPPSFALSFKIGEQVGVGVSAGAPYLSRSEWDAAWGGRQLTTSFEHRTGVLAPAASFSPIEGISLGVSLPLRLTKNVATSWLIEPGVGPPPGRASQRSIEGESAIEVGVQAGVLVSRERWSIGASYASGWDVTIADAEASRSQEDPASSGPSYSGAPATISMSLPAELAVGATISPLPALLLTTEIDVVMWSSARKIQFDVPGTTDGYTIPQEWKDAFRLGIGAEYRFSEIDLRAGFSYDESPVPDATAHPAYPDADRFAYSAGLGFRVGPGLQVDLAISAFAFKDRRVEDSEHTIVNESTGTPGQAFNGTYRTAASSISLSISYLWR